MRQEVPRRMPPNPEMNLPMSLSTESLYRKISAFHPNLILPSFRRVVGRVRRRGYDIVPAGTQIGRKSGRLVQRVLRILRGAERLVRTL